MNVGVPQRRADVVEEPRQWAQLQEGFLQGEGFQLGLVSVRTEVIWIWEEGREERESGGEGSALKTPAMGPQDLF